MGRLLRRLVPGLEVLSADRQRLRREHRLLWRLVPGLQVHLIPK